MARSTYTPPPSQGAPTALLVVTGAIGLISAIATIIALVRSGGHPAPGCTSCSSCAAEKAGILDKLKAAQFAKDAIAAGTTDPWKIAADGWASLLNCPGLPGAFTKATPPDRVKLFAASVLYVVDLLKSSGKITEATKAGLSAEVTSWATGLGVTL